MKGFDPTAGRRYAVEMIPRDAYWRAPITTEHKIDFAELEIERGRVLQGESLRFGLIVSGHMAWVLDWIRRPGFGPKSLSSPPAELMSDEFAAELSRLFVRTFWEGTRKYASWMARQDKIEGRDPRQAVAPVALRPASIAKMRANAAQLAIGISRGIWSRLAPVIESTWGPDGRWLKTVDQVEAEIRSIYGQDYLRQAPRELRKEDILALSGGWSVSDSGNLILLDERKRKEPQSEAEYLDWQRKNLPYSQWMKAGASEIVRTGGTLPELTLNMLSRWVATERTRFFTHGIVAAAQDDPAVAMLTFSAIGDSPHCAVCKSRDGTTRPKDDLWWAYNQPPLHHGCNCIVVPGTKREMLKVTPMTALPSQADVAVGFGTYDKEAAAVTRRINVPMPSGGRYSQALQRSGYRKILRQRTTVGERAATRAGVETRAWDDEAYQRMRDEANRRLARRRYSQPRPDWSRWDGRIWVPGQ